MLFYLDKFITGEIFTIEVIIKITLTLYEQDIHTRACVIKYKLSLCVYYDLYATASTIGDLYVANGI